MLDGGVCKKIKYLLLNFDLGDGTGPLEDGVSPREHFSSGLGPEKKG